MRRGERVRDDSYYLACLRQYDPCGVSGFWRGEVARESRDPPRRAPRRETRPDAGRDGRQRAVGTGEAYDKKPNAKPFSEKDTSHDEQRNARARWNTPTIDRRMPVLHSSNQYMLL